jgi:hypothetical protein
MIPSEIALMVHLQYLIVGAQGLTGSIPASLASLGPLRFLFLPDTQLTGAVPAFFSGDAN